MPLLDLDQDKSSRKWYLGTMRLILVILLGVSGMLALSVIAPGVSSAPSSSAFAIMSPGDFDEATGDCCGNYGPCSHDRCEGGACVCPACAGAAAAIQGPPDFILGLPAAGTYSRPIPTEPFHHGVTVRPITGPPRLFG
jgi:hypothetical protein